MRKLLLLSIIVFGLGGCAAESTHKDNKNAKYQIDDIRIGSLYKIIYIDGDKHDQ